MKIDFINRIKQTNLFGELFSSISALNGELNKLFISPLYGASKAFLIKELLKHEFQNSWRFNTIENWLKDVDLLEDSKVKIRELTDMMKEKVK